MLPMYLSKSAPLVAAIGTLTQDQYSRQDLPRLAAIFPDLWPAVARSVPTHGAGGGVRHRGEADEVAVRHRLADAGSLHRHLRSSARPLPR